MKAERRARMWVVIGAVVLSAAPGLSESGRQTSVRTDQARPTGVFSDMRWVKGPDDLVGYEVFVLHSSQGDEPRFWALFQRASGVPNTPVLVEAKVDGREISFQLTGQYAYLGTFSGVIGAKALVGTFGGTKAEVRLPRRPSVWQ